jgi:hypothetical protein
MILFLSIRSSPSSAFRRSRALTVKKIKVIRFVSAEGRGGGI